MNVWVRLDGRLARATAPATAGATIIVSAFSVFKVRDKSQFTASRFRIATIGCIFRTAAVPALAPLAHDYGGGG